VASRVKQSRVTIKDIAKAAGVSVTTVSDSMSGNGRLPEETRARVRAVAAELGYRPSPAARSLQRGKTGLLMLSVAAPDTPTSALWSIDFFVNVLTSAATTASTAGYALALAPESLSPSLAFDGAIVVDPVADNSLVALARREGRPVVTIGRLADATSGWVDNDYPVLVVDILEHLWARGARRPALLATGPTTSYVQDILAAYQSWCTRRKVAPQVEHVAGGATQESGHEAAARLLERRPRPDAMLVTLDHLALGALAAAESRRLAVPDDLRIVSIGDSAMIAHSRVPLTAADLAPAELGARAVEMLIDRIGASDDDRPGPVVVPATLIPRAST
jgi:DNA-binding LacI/PurR family transcriptional regulator